jgi:hypothetical protein
LVAAGSILNKSRELPGMGFTCCGCVWKGATRLIS